MTCKRVMTVLCIVVALLAIVASTATTVEDEKECADQLTNLASCIPFVSGTAKKPTRECCEDTEKLKASKPKCLCLLIKESTDPFMDLPVNTTLALQMPSACNFDAKISDCPAILNLAPNSPEAKIFKEADPDSSSMSTTSPPASGSSTTSPYSSGSGSNSGSKANPRSNDCANLKLLRSLNLLVLMALIAWLFF